MHLIVEATQFSAPPYVLGDFMEYITVKAVAQAEFIEKKSRFIGNIAPASTKDEAEAFIAAVNGSNRDARHNVFAYCLKGGFEKASDNGEPSGTAGAPTLDVIHKEGLTDVCIVTTRYFGGILLGGGGLTRAYSHAASIAVAAAEKKIMTLCSRIKLSCEYGFYGKLSYALPQFTHLIENSRFEEEVVIELLLKNEEQDKFFAVITELSNGQLAPNKGIERVGEEFAEIH